MRSWVLDFKLIYQVELQLSRGGLIFDLGVILFGIVLIGTADVIRSGLIVEFV